MSYAFINNTKHFAVASSAQLVQDALNNETMGNPYVAIVDGDLDYNSLGPEECHIGEWESTEEPYTFVFDTNPSLWTGATKIGTLIGVYSDGNHEDLDVMLSYNQYAGNWHMEFFSEIASDIPQYDFTEGVSYVWVSDAMTYPDDSDAAITVDWDGTDTFMFQTSDDLHTLSMTTINPECEQES